jgi:hypothetical protein
VSKHIETKETAKAEENSIVKAKIMSTAEAE